MKIGKCDNCNARTREAERRDLFLPARHGEPAMMVRGGGCKRCAPDHEMGDEPVDTRTHADD